MKEIKLETKDVEITFFNSDYFQSSQGNSVMMDAGYTEEHAKLALEVMQTRGSKISNYVQLGKKTKINGTTAEVVLQSLSYSFEQVVILKEIEGYLVLEIYKKKNIFESTKNIYVKFNYYEVEKTKTQRTSYSTAVELDLNIEPDYIFRIKDFKFEKITKDGEWKEFLGKDFNEVLKIFAKKSYWYEHTYPFIIFSGDFDKDKLFELTKEVQSMDITTQAVFKAARSKASRYSRKEINLVLYDLFLFGKLFNRKSFKKYTNSKLHKLVLEKSSKNVPAEYSTLVRTENYDFIYLTFNGISKFVLIFDSIDAGLYYYDERFLGTLTRIETQNLHRTIRPGGHFIENPKSSIRFLLEEGENSIQVTNENVRILLGDNVAESLIKISNDFFKVRIKYEKDMRKALRMIFASIDLKAKTPYQYVGLNKNQFDLFNNLMFDGVIELKVALLGVGKADQIPDIKGHSIANYDINLSEKIYKLITKFTTERRKQRHTTTPTGVIPYDNGGHNFFAILRNAKSLEYAIDFFENYLTGKLFWKDFHKENHLEMVNAGRNLFDSIILYGLTKDRIKTIEHNNEEVPLGLKETFKSAGKLLKTSYNDSREIEELHEVMINITNIYNIYRRHPGEIVREFKEEQLKRMEKFEFESEDYKITYPKNTSEIINEGILLSHCVGSYAQRAYEDKTTILFLRKKEKINDSFFTLEVNNLGKVVQVYGNHNTTINKHPEKDSLNKFLKTWIRKNKLTGEYK